MCLMYFCCPCQLRIADHQFWLLLWLIAREEIGESERKRRIVSTWLNESRAASSRLIVFGLVVESSYQDSDVRVPAELLLHVFHRSSWSCRCPMAVLAVATSPAPTAAPHAHKRIRWDTAQPHGKEGAQSDAMGIGGKAERRRLSGTQADSPVPTVPMRLGWPERRVVRGPQGPPCSSAPVFTLCIPSPVFMTEHQLMHCPM